MKTFKTVILIAGILVAGIAFNTIAQPAHTNSKKKEVKVEHRPTHKDKATKVNHITGKKQGKHKRSPEKHQHKLHKTGHWDKGMKS